MGRAILAVCAHPKRLFSQNPRIGILLKMWDNMDDANQKQHLNSAESFLKKLDDNLLTQ